jgi:tRNA U34 2-thiouridine synthase MnmA/TrmU
MTSSLKKIRALGLSSGGLDSILSALILRNQGIEVEWITFETPFFSSAKARQAASKSKIPITVENITKTYIKMLKNPPCGYGKHMNPCLDCHALMFKLAGKIMKNKGFNFLFSGEVLGQRPMSQTKSSLRYVEKNSGMNGYILRPLSAKRLTISIPEKEGLVNRDLLLDISGRSRKPQIKLAEKFGIKEYPNPAGGCLLTDKGYSDRLKDLFEHQKTYTEKELHLLKYGRHLRLNNKKLIIGRTKQDNEKIIKYHNSARDTVIKVKNFPSPIVLIPNRASKSIIIKAASICAGYSKVPDNKKIDVYITTPSKSEIIKVKKMSPEEVKSLLI